MARNNDNFRGKNTPNPAQAIRGGGGQGMRGAMQGGEKAKDFKKSIKQLAIYLREFWPAIVSGLIFAALSTVLAIFGPKILSKMTEEVILGTLPGVSMNFVRITQIGIWLIVLYVASAVFNFLQNFIMAGVTAKVSKKLRGEISAKINRMPLKYFDSNSYGDVLSRVTNDVDTIGQTLNQSLSSIITSVTTIIGVIIMMFTISWELTLVNMVSVPVMMVLIIIVVKASQKYFKQQQTALGSINGHIEEIYSGHSVVKIFNGVDTAAEQFDEVNETLRKSAYKSQFLSGFMMPIMGFVGNLAFVFICVIGGVIALKDVTFIASIVAFVTYSKQFNQPLNQIASIASTLQSTAAAAERVFEFLESEEQSDESAKRLTIEEVKGKVEFRDVRFGYLENKEIIHGFNCTANPGQKIAIVGPTGAGKTTMVNLLMRFYETNSGDILIDDVPVKSMNREYVRSLFGMVLQDTWLFEGTIRENLAFGKPDATDEEIITACKAAKVDRFVESLPGGYDMVLKEDSDLSQGQRQLLTIARAMVQNAPMLILDEATSSVDTRTEVLIQEAMDKLTRGRTSFVIAHRLSTIKNADIILVMSNGDIIEKGTHEDLLQAGGFYADLYNSQFSLEAPVEDDAPIEEHGGKTFYEVKMST